MATIREIITGSLRLIEVVGAGEAVTAEDAADALTALNAMLDSWSVDGNKVWTEAIEAYSVSATRLSYTIGPGGNINTAVPVDIINISLQLGNLPSVPLDRMNAYNYAQFADTTLQLMPSAFYYKYGTPLATIYFNSVLNQAYTMQLTSKKALSNYSSINDTLIAPPGWIRAIRYNLAREIAPEFGKSLSPEARSIAVESLQSIENQISNLSSGELGFDGMLLAAGVGGGFSLPGASTGGGGGNGGSCDSAMNYTSNHTFTASECGTIGENSGATAGIILTLPAAVAGLRYGAYVAAPYLISLVAQGTDVIRNGDLYSVNGGSIVSDDVGDFVRLMCVINGIWIVDGIVGEWELN
jgi:hypothetical protein